MKKYKAGVRIAMGSDSCHDGRVHGHAARTTVMMVKYGMSEMDAIVATTKAAAEACKLEDQVGTLEGQKLADMIMVDGDPLKDIGVLLNKQKILMVMKEGEILIDRRGSQA
jgi:imidazolonepropionase-like amidohydrolase